MSTEPSSLPRETLVMAVLLVVVPLTLVGGARGWPSGFQFVLSLVSVVPLAAFIGNATEALAEHWGGKIGGLLNATFGNAPDLLIGIFGVQKGLILLIKATLVGALISNSALIMGLCYLVAGLTHGHPTFRREEAGHHSVLMLLAVAAILFPSIGPLTDGHVGSSTTLHISVGIAVVLLVLYLAYVAYGIFGWEQLPHATTTSSRIPEPARKAPGSETGWPLWLSVVILVGATAALVPVTDVLTGSVQPVGRALGWTDVFVGMVIVANTGNVAEAYAALKFARQRSASPDKETNSDSGLDLSLSIASASSVQIATFVAPLIVLYSLFQHPMNLVFSPIEIAILGLLAIIFAYIAHDGESNWLEGIQLIGLYAMAAIIFYALPLSAFSAGA